MAGAAGGILWVGRFGAAMVVRLFPVDRVRSKKTKRNAMRYAHFRSSQRVDAYDTANKDEEISGD